jgi:hypothetical protein
MDEWNQKKLLTTWAILGRLKNGDKLSVHANDIYIDRKSVLTPLKRAWYGDSRDELITFIPQIIGNTIVLFSENEDMKESRTITEIVFKGMHGLLTFKHTYSNDIIFLSQFDIAFEEVKKMKIYFSNVNAFDTFFI